MRLGGLVAATLAAALASGLAAGAAGALESAGPRFSRTDRFEISYARDPAAEVANVELYFTADGGQTWKRAGEDPALSGKIAFQAPGEGNYGFVTVAVSKAGRRTRLPDATTVPTDQVIVDLTPPEVTTRGPAEGTLVQVAPDVEISWKAEDRHLGPDPVEIQMRTDARQEWGVLAAGRSAEGRQTIRLPQLKSGRVEFRVVARDRAGNVGAAAAGSLEVDMLPPTGRIVKPRLAATLDIEIYYDLKDEGPARLASASIWSTANGGRTWQKLADAPVTESSVKVRLPRQGAYGLALAAADRADNLLSAPDPGTAPEFTVICDTDPPRLALREPVEGAAFAGGSVVPVLWSAEDQNFGDGPITVECSTDGGDTWVVAARGAANTGRFGWKAPAIDSAKCLVRVRAEDLAGNSSVVVSRPFMLDSTAPATRARAGLPPEEDRRRRAAEGLLRGRSLLASDPAAAARELEAAAELDPQAAGVQDLLGEAHYRSGIGFLGRREAKPAAAALGRAAECFGKALAAGGDSWVRRYNLSLALIGLARVQEDPAPTRARAAAELAKALELAGPEEAAERAGVAWYQAVLKEDEGDRVQAARWWRRAAELYGRESSLGRKALENAQRAERRR